MSEGLTAKARLRDAAIAMIADGVPLTARAVAERAGVTPGLIRHHFGSMAKLEAACDAHIAQLVKDGKNDAIAAGANTDVLGAIRATGDARIMPYLARRLTSRSPRIDALVDQMAADAAEYIQSSIDVGLMNPLRDVPRAAKMLTVYSLGSLVLHEHLHRLLDIDITSNDLTSEPGIADYLAVHFELFSGMMSADVIAKLQQQTPTQE